MRLVRGLKIHRKEVEVGSMRGDGKLCFTKKDGGTFWKVYVERIMNEESDWDHNVEGHLVAGLTDCVSRDGWYKHKKIKLEKHLNLQM